MRRQGSDKEWWLTRRRGSDTRKFFWTVLISLGFSTLLLAFAVGILAATGYTPQSIIKIQEWGTSLLINFACGLLIIGLVGLLMRWYQVPENSFSEWHDTLHEAGIRRIVSDWVQHKPTEEFFREVFSQADIVEIIGITLTNTLIGFSWFPEELAKRIKVPRKTTRLLFLKPDGVEIRRRESEGRGRSVRDRATKAVEQIVNGLKMAGLAEEDYSHHLRYFDYAPIGNWLRLGDSAYLVIHMHARGGFSPALEFDGDGWFFHEFERHFDSMWEDAGRRISV